MAVYMTSVKTEFANKIASRKSTEKNKIKKYHKTKKVEENQGRDYVSMFDDAFLHAVSQLVSPATQRGTSVL